MSTKGIDLVKVLEKNYLLRQVEKVGKGIIDLTFYIDDQNRVGTRLIKAAEIPTAIEKQKFY